MESSPKIVVLGHQDQPMKPACFQISASSAPVIANVAHMYCPRKDVSDQAGSDESQILVE